MYEDIRVFIGPSDAIPEEYLKSRTKKLEENNANNNNTNTTQTKINPIFSEK